jgi:hypothetical protein
MNWLGARYVDTVFTVAMLAFADPSRVNAVGDTFVEITNNSENEPVAHTQQIAWRADEFHTRQIQRVRVRLASRYGGGV